MSFNSSQGLLGRSFWLVSAIALVLMSGPGHAASNVGLGRSYAWGANIGWLDWRADVTHGAEIGQFICSGSIYAANVGWIDLGRGAPQNGIRYQNNSATDFGVNVSPSGELRGLAYGANIGWVNFENLGAPRVDLATGKLSGFVYGANVGWISLEGNHVMVAVDSLAEGADKDADGIPDAWELLLAQSLSALSAAGDADGDGQSDLAEYRADTDPLDPEDNLRVIEYTVADNQPVSNVTWTTRPTRRYFVETRSALAPSVFWEDSGLGLVTPDGAVTSRSVPNRGPAEFFRIRAERPLSL